MNYSVVLWEENDLDGVGQVIEQEELAAWLRKMADRAEKGQSIDCIQVVRNNNQKENS